MEIYRGVLNTRLEASGKTLTEAIVNDAKSCVLNNTSNKGKAIKEKLEMVLKKNSGYTAME